MDWPATNADIDEFFALLAKEPRLTCAYYVRPVLDEKCCITAWEMVLGGTYRLSVKPLKYEWRTIVMAICPTIEAALAARQLFSYSLNS